MGARKPTVEIGQKYGHLTVVDQLDKRNKSGNRIYLLKCDCGNFCEKSTDKLRQKRNPSVYCSKQCNLIERTCKHFITHGKYKTQEYRLYFLAKKRAKEKGIEFNIEVDDITIPSVCPILEIPLTKNNIGWAADIPTLDRIDPNKGYIKGNIKVISGKANVMKNNATIEELKKFTENIFNYLQD